MTDTPASTPAGADAATPAAVRPGVTVRVVPELDEARVTVTGDLGPRAAALVSCRLHEAIAVAGKAVVLDLGATDAAADPALARVLVCARESAAARGLALRTVDAP